MNNYNILQRTISNPVSFSGVGLHSGDTCNVTLKPCEADTGIVFIRKDLKENNLYLLIINIIHKSNFVLLLNHITLMLKY